MTPQEKLDRIAFVRDCPEFEYSYSPKQTEADTRYVFKDRVAVTNVGGTALDKAYHFAREVFEKRLKDFTKEELSYKHGIPAIVDLQDISWVYGPEVKSRMWLMTFEKDPDYGDEMPIPTATYHVFYTDDFKEIKEIIEVKEKEND